MGRVHLRLLPRRVDHDHWYTKLAERTCSNSNACVSSSGTSYCLPDPWHSSDLTYTVHQALCLADNGSLCGRDATPAPDLLPLLMVARRDYNQPS
jgi:hypothetical protein